VDSLDRIALVTGAAHRVGYAIASGLAEHGYHLMLHYHRSERLVQEAVKSLSAHGVEVEMHQADLQKPAQIEALFQHVYERFQRLDVLVNSAAIMQRIEFDEVGVEDWSSTINLNLRAPFFCIQHAARIMKRNHGGVIINISDIAGLKPWPRFPVHSISKAGVDMLTRVAARTYAPEIRINAIAPGPVLKPDGMSGERWEQIGARLPLGKPGNPAAIVEAVLFLIQNDAITGETLAVDGGDQLVE
jgi:pteridine reductase